MDDMTFDEAVQHVRAGGTVIHRSWPGQGYRCYLFRRDGLVWIHHTDGSEHPFDLPRYRRTISSLSVAGGWTTELID